MEALTPVLTNNKEEHVAESTTTSTTDAPAPAKGATAPAKGANGATAPASAAKPNTTTYIAFSLRENKDEDWSGWVPVMDGKEQREFVVPSGQVERVQQEACVQLKKEQPLAAEFKIAVVSARFWTEEEFEMEPPPPPSFKRRGA